MKITKQNLKKFFQEKGFEVNLTDEGAELETWTKAGVNMLLYVCPFTVEGFKEAADDFDMDEEIDLHRESQDYKDAFSIKQSVEDFERYHNRLKMVILDLQKVKTFYMQDNIGRAKYTVSYHDGIKLHKDGSAFYDLEIFRRKSERDKFIKQLIADGYTEK